MGASLHRALAVSLAAIFFVVLEPARTPAATGSPQPGVRALVRPRSGSGQVPPEGTYFAGESLQVGTREIRLFRSRQKVAVLHAPSQGVRAAAVPGTLAVDGRWYALERYINRPRLTVLETSRFSSGAEQTKAMRALERQTSLGAVVPVYIHADSGLELIPTGSVVVRLATNDAEAELALLHQRLGTVADRRLRGTPDQYVLSVAGATAEELFGTCTLLAAEPAVVWAEPEFVGQVVRHAFTPNDPLFDPNQWHLPDIQVPDAWDVVTGSDEIVIAIMDDAVEFDHEDLKDAFPSNPGEIDGDGLDNDRNGWTDDVYGWDFYDNDDDPSPTDEAETHGTQVAGVAAATGNNGLGGVGAAFGCRLMALKVFRGEPEEMDADILYPALAEAFYYAAGRTASGKGTWRGADIISISLGFAETNAINEAIQYAATQGRDGRGCPTLCAAGNEASGWLGIELRGFEEGEYQFRWEYAKNGSRAFGDDTVWLDNIIWPGEEVEAFTDVNLPEGWTTGGDTEWVTVEEGVDGNHALPAEGPFAPRSVRPGPVPDWGRSYLELTRELEAGSMNFWVWESSEPSYSAQVGSYERLTFNLLDWLWPFSPEFVQHRRMQFICLREELGWNELFPGPVRRLRFAEFYILEPPDEWLDSVTIRLKHIPHGQDSYFSPRWDTAGWTTVYDQQNVPLKMGTLFDLGDSVAQHLVRFDFDTDFTYDPRYNLAVDISISESGFDFGGYTLLWRADETRAIVGDESMTTTPAVQWAGAEGNATVSRSVPLMWFGSGDELRFFVDGSLVLQLSGVRSVAPDVSYPAAHPSTIAVGASTDAGNRAWYSQFGDKLDFVAPSNGGTLGITTTDIMGKGGDDPGNYTVNFGGTSSATPLASGVVALVLSRNPALTADEVRMLMRQTCDQIGEEPYVDGRSEEYGYGRINALAAVNAAAE